MRGPFRLSSYDKFVVLYDHKYRLLHSSRLHRALLRLDASELYGRSFEQFQSESQAAIVNSVGGPRGWIKNGILKVEATLLRKPYERARNPRASAQRGGAWTIRDGLELPLVLGMTHEIPFHAHRDTPPVFTTLDHPVP